MKPELAREVDEYELSMHRKSAIGGFLVGGILMLVAVSALLFLRVIFIGMLIVPGVGLLLNAANHWSKARILKAQLRR
jgi:hypothetical protein